ncbi:helix-turn-helix transcriptional regulator [Bacillus sp. FSL W8-0183]|uniref:helix-turn-helix transcriptional regulator n=1 Tax=Bacillus sp. FSL W8-0183 TaxID=2954568 RepID=UPI0030F85AD9
MLNVEIGQCHIPNLLKEKNWTQADLARATGLTPQTIFQIINQPVDIRIKTAAKIAMSLGCRIDDLFEFRIRH